MTREQLEINRQMLKHLEGLEKLYDFLQGSYSGTTTIVITRENDRGGIIDSAQVYENLLPGISPVIKREIQKAEYHIKGL